jgi:hypothetical protein
MMRGLITENKEEKRAGGARDNTTHLLLAGRAEKSRSSMIVPIDLETSNGEPNASSGV